MKLRLLLASLCVVCSTGFVFGAEPVEKKVNSYLLFTLNNEWRIVAAKKHNMEYLVSPKKFKGMIITDAVPLNDVDKAAITTGLTEARENNSRTKVPYTLQDTQFVAAIKYKQDKDAFSVKVRQAEQAS